MKLTKILLWIAAVALIPLCTIVMADDCFDTVVDKDENVYYIDPFDEWRVAINRETLLSEYGDKIKCTGEKKVYTSEEYMDKVYGDLRKDAQRQQSYSSWGNALLELVIFILWIVAMRKIFVKAWKPGIYSIIPIYNFYELTDIAWLQGMFWKVLLCWLVWIGLCFFMPILWMILIFICVIYGAVVDYYVAKNFWWSTIASILYVIFNPIAMIILAFWNYEYNDLKWVQKEEIREIAKKIQNDEVMGKEKVWNINNNVNNTTPERIDEEFDDNIPSPNSTWTEEDPIKYIDPTNFA
jgi:hypothetical protein